MLSMLSAPLLGGCPKHRQGVANSCSMRNLAFVDAVPYKELNPFQQVGTRAASRSCVLGV